MTSKRPPEAVVSIEWTGHRLLYLEAVIVEATRQGRPYLVIVDKKALNAPEWPRIDAALVGGHSLHTVDFEAVDLKQALPESIEHVVALEADSLMINFLRILRERPRLRASLQLMREPDDAGLGHGARSLAASGAKAALIGVLNRRFGSRCRIHVLRSPLFPPTSVTKTLAAKGWCTTLVDPVLNSDGPQTNHVVRNGHPTDGTPIALVTGQLNARKSLESLLDAWADPALRGYRLVLSGRVVGDTPVRRLVDEARQLGADVELNEGYLSDDDLSRAMAEAAAVLCLYQSDVPSGVAALAIQAGCPVVAFANTRLGRALAARGLGAAVTDIEGRELVAAIETCRALSRTSVARTAADLHESATTEVFSRQLLGENTGATAVAASGALAASSATPKKDRQLFFTAKAQYENAGDLVINRLALRELQKHGVLNVNRSQAPDGYLGALGLADESTTKWLGNSLWFLRLVTSAARGQKPVLVFRPGGDRISGSVSTLDRTKAALFAQLSRANIVQTKYGASFHGQKSLNGGRIQHLDSLLVRDHDSYRECVSSSDGHIGLIPDMACLLPFDPHLGGRILDRERNLMSICLRSIETGANAWVGVESLHMLATELDLSTVVVSQVKLDEETSAAAARRLSAPLVRWKGDLTTLLQVLDIYERSRFTVTSRLHAALLAALCGSCPIVIETPKGKSRKVAACFEFLELGDLVVGSVSEATALTRKLADDGIPPHIAASLQKVVDGTVGRRASEAIADDLDRLLQ